MDVSLQVQQSEDIANFASRITQKYRNCMVVDLSDGSCYCCGLRSMEDSSFEDPAEKEVYSDWLRIFVETEIELPEQSRMRWILSPENIKQSLNDHHFFISVSYRNRKLPGNECWQKLQIVLLESDKLGIPQRVMIVQEKINGSVLMREQRFFKSNLIGVMQFAVNTDGLNRWRRFSYLNVNDEALRIFGYTHDEFYEGMRNQQIDLIAPYDIANFIDLVSSLSEIGDRSEVHLHVINRSGYIVTIGGEAELCISDDGRRFIQIIFIDESKNESSKTALADLKMELKDFTEAIPCAVHRSLMAGKSTTEYVNREFTILTGYDCTDLKINFDGVFQSILATPEDVKIFNTGFSRALTTGKRVAVDFSLKRSDGSIVSVRDWLYVTHDKQDRLWLYGSMIENTDEKNTEKKAENLQEIVQYYSEGLDFIQKISCFAFDSAYGSSSMKFSEIVDLISVESDSTVVAYVISEDGKTASPEYSRFSENDRCETPIILTCSEIQKCLDSMKNQHCLIIPNRIIMKSVLSPDLFEKNVFKNVDTVLFLPYEYKDGHPAKFLLVRNPESWLIHHKIPQCVSENLSVLHKIFK
jgi:PAS domain-containing protein